MKPDAPFHLMLATPAFGGQLTAIYASSVLALLEDCQDRGLSMEVAVQWGDSLVSRARQDLVTRFLETPRATHLLFIDADIGFTSDQVFRLVEFEAEMASGVYPYKHLDLERIRKVYEKKTRVRSPEIWSYGVEFEEPGKITVKNGFAKALYAGLGFSLIKKSVFQKMIQHYPELKYTDGFLPSDPFPESSNRYALFNDFIDGSIGRYLPEDLSFCRRWTRIGGEIWVDSQSRLRHVGPTVFDGDFSTQFTPPNP